ncbi:DNA gyrase inhibitor [Anoxybacillus thermarum]|uniref:DNA gyrase inhibitor n=1 Tax=Anoxybacillus thermarum TaxID=404937 RepID=A0A0D0RVU1_9BACL|nr:GyrI-like domain-containing protein [Anoxybacillus thermarum]KIQ93495.1 DNA gyrase inhibitor [Anoxybacillus thermarum]
MTFAFFYRASLGGPDERREQKFATLVGESFLNVTHKYFTHTITITHDTWAVIPNVDEAWKRLHSEWLPASRYELAHAPLIECYYPPNHHPENELWIPIKQK